MSLRTLSFQLQFSFMLIALLPFLTFAIKNVAGLLDAVSCLLESVVRLLQSIKKLKKTIMYKSHKKKLPHNSWRNKR